MKARERDCALQVIVALFLNECCVSYVKPGSFIRSKEKTCLSSRSPVNVSWRLASAVFPRIHRVYLRYFEDLTKRPAIMEDRNKVQGFQEI